MKLSTPIYRLKAQAKRDARESGITYIEALDRLAREEGFARWSLLAARYAEQTPAREVFQLLEAGQLMLLGARPQQGKTLLSLELAMQATAAGAQASFFSFELNEEDVHARLQELGYERSSYAGKLHIWYSQEISSSFVESKVAEADAGSLVVIDYLQLLDQKRTNPDLATQVAALKALAQAKGLRMVCISQVLREFSDSVPQLADVRLPNPVDLSLFDQACFLHEGALHLDAVA